LKKSIIKLIMLAVIVSFAGFSWAAETVYVQGTVESYQEGKTITVQDEEGESHTFQITEDSSVEEGVEAGVTVEVEANGNHADYITVQAVEEEEISEE